MNINEHLLTCFSEECAEIAASLVRANCAELVIKAEEKRRKEA